MSIGMIRAVLIAISLSASAVGWAGYASWELKGDNALQSRNYPLALEIFQRAAEQGEVKASYHIGQVYAYKKDLKQAMFWYLKGAEEGDSTAQFELGNIYLGPETYGYPSILQDMVQAYKWLDLASKDLSSRFQKDGIESRDIAATQMTPAQIKQAQSLVRKWKPKVVKIASQPNTVVVSDGVKIPEFTGLYAVDGNKLIEIERGKGKSYDLSSNVKFIVYQSGHNGIAKAVFLRDVHHGGSFGVSHKNEWTWLGGDKDIIEMRKKPVLGATMSFGSPDMYYDIPRSPLMTGAYVILGVDAVLFINKKEPLLRQLECLDKYENGLNSKYEPCETNTPEQ